MTGRGVAIVGMACLFPKAPDLATYWNNICAGVDAITDVPASRWDPLFYDPASTAPDRFYARRGGFVDADAQFDAAAFGIMPIAAQGAEPDQLLALRVAVDALADAGYAQRGFARDRTSVILGRGNYLGPGIARLVNLTRGAQQLVESLQSLLPDLGAAQLSAIKQDFQSRCGVYGPDTAIGLVPNLLASRIANRLDLGGSAYTVDAACASALIALEQGCRELRDGRADVVLTGGVHLCHDLAFWSVFSQLGALSRSQHIRPFDRRADGLLIGEGIGVLVLKREEDARAANDRVYAVIRGVGTASDGRDVSLLTPRVEGQVLALTRAWRDAGLDPQSVGLVEAHGTATAAGDAAELETLARVFGGRDDARARIPLGSVKSMIGHAMPAAGAAGVIKAALAVYHGIRPPTLHCEEPNPAMQNTRFRSIPRMEPWDEATRRAAVNAFGFGGINAHVVLEADAMATHGSPPPMALSATATRPLPVAAALLLAAASQNELLAALDAGGKGGHGSWRLAVFDPTPERIGSARAAVAAGRSRHGRDGIYFAPRGLVSEGGKLAFLFPGVEGTVVPAVDDIAAHFAMAPPRLDAAHLEDMGASVLALNAFLQQVTRALGLVPDAIAGHSIGEWSAMLAAGMFERASVEDMTAALQPGTLRVADVAYVAVGAGAQRVEGLIEGLADVAVSHDNCPHQSIVCAPAFRVEVLASRLRDARVLHEVLPFRSGFHSPALASHAAFYAQNLARLELTRPAIPLWSATTCAPYPTERDAVHALFIDHLTKPVRFRELILALHAEGVRVFVQVGAGSLAAFVDDVLAGKPHHALSLISAQRSGLAQLQRAGAALHVEGAALDLRLLGVQEHAPAAVRKPLTLELGVPLVRLDLPPLRNAATPSATVIGDDPVARAFDAGMREVATAHDAVLRAFSTAVWAPGAKSAPPVVPATRTDRIALSIAAFPELFDHSLIPQPPAWPTLADRAPAVPFTMSIILLMEAAQRLAPDRMAVAVERVVAHTWLHVEPPVEVEVVSTRIDGDRIAVKIGSFVEGIVTMAVRYPAAPPAAIEPLVELRPFPIPVAGIYRDGWLFHGPRYQGVVDVEACGGNGLLGTLQVTPGKGALLDAAGQLLGLWVMQACAADRLAMPIRVARIDFFGPEPHVGTRLACTVWTRHLGRHDVRADFELRQGDRVHARVTGWEDWRFHTGGGIFDVMRRPHESLLATVDPAGFVIVSDPGWTTATFEFLVRRFMSARELDGLGGMRRAQRKSDWLSGRIAAKDAVRHWLFERGHAPLYPVEITIEPDANGRPVVRGPFAEDLRVSIAHAGGIACAIAAAGVDPGIDVETIEPRSEGFAAFGFSAAELRLLPAGDRDEWLTRMWSAKEAVGKACGTGLAGNPKAFAVTAFDGERIEVHGRWVKTRRQDQTIIAWTEQ